MSGFAHPQLLWLLWAIPLLGVSWWWLRRRRPGARLTHPDTHLVRHVRRRRWALPTLIVCAWTAVGVIGILAAAGPTREVQVPREQATVMLAIDVSRSMTATDIAPDRLSAAISSAQRFVRSLPPNYRVGLVSFSGTANVLVPPTTDHTQVAGALGNLVADGATAIGDAVVASIDAVKRADGGFIDGESTSVFLLSDGANSTGVTLDEAIRTARRDGVKVSTIALGTPGGILPDGRPVAPDVPALANLARETGGKAFETRSAAALQEVYASMGTSVGRITLTQSQAPAWALVALVVAMLACALTLLRRRVP